MKHYKIFKTLLMIPLVAAFLWACSNGSSGSSQGTLSVGLTDTSTDRYLGVYVTVSEIQVHRSPDGEETEAGWITIGTPNTTYNLLDLVNGVRESLGLADLDTGHYTQMRLILGDTADNSINIFSEPHFYANYVIDLVGNTHKLKVPSGMQTGIKIVQGFDVSENETTELVLDFNAGASVVIAGNSGQYLLKPTINMLVTSDASIISGTVTKLLDDSGLSGATVSAQIFDSTATDAEDRVNVRTATMSGDGGNYALFISPGTYNLVFYKTGYDAYVKKITVGAGDTVTQDGALDATTIGTLALTSSISDNDSEAYATQSIREDITMDDNNIEIELFSLNIADGGSSLMMLPTGEVIVVSSSYAETTQSTTFIINTDIEAALDISL
ncbi:MAG: DUF4382 domain-containing protein [Deltaproteobacteria bacterium]|nr:DUF4382 domain-containing protein [Deltaproteobacteria bacterium]